MEIVVVTVLVVVVASRFVTATIAVIVGSVITTLLVVLIANVSALLTTAFIVTVRVATRVVVTTVTTATTSTTSTTVRRSLAVKVPMNYQANQDERVIADIKVVTQNATTILDKRITEIVHVKECNNHISLVLGIRIFHVHSLPSQATTSATELS